jgi:hypothetical protein
MPSTLNPCRSSTHWLTSVTSACLRTACINHYEVRMRAGHMAMVSSSIYGP